MSCLAELLKKKGIRQAPIIIIKERIVYRNNEKQCFAVLNLSKNATRQDVIKRFRQLANLYHPDKTEGEKEAFQRLLQAKTDALKLV